MKAEHSWCRKLLEQARQGVPTGTVQGLGLLLQCVPCWSSGQPPAPAQPLWTHSSAAKLRLVWLEIWLSFGSHSPWPRLSSPSTLLPPL